MMTTYLALLNDVAAGRQPEKVIYRNHVYEWDGNEYMRDGRSLSEQMLNWTTKAQTHAEILQYDYRVLTNDERSYLKAVIKPWRSDVKGIRKTVAIAGERCIVIHCRGGMVDLPNFPADIGMYSGMETNKIYTLDELGI